MNTDTKLSGNEEPIAVIWIGPCDPDCKHDELLHGFEGCTVEGCNCGGHWRE